MSKPFPAALLPLVPSSSFNSAEHEFAGMREGVEAAIQAFTSASNEEGRRSAMSVIVLASARAQSAWHRMPGFDGRPWVSAYPLGTLGVGH